MTVESLIVTSAGSAAGLAIAVFGLRAFVNLAPPGIPRLDEVGVDLPVVLFVAAVGVLSGLVFGIVPVMRRTDGLTAALGDGGRGSTGGRVRQRARELLVVTQLALALTLLVTSGLMVRSFFELRAVDPGCDPQGVVAVKLPIPDAEYPEPGDALSFYRELVEKVQALPGVERAGVTTSIPVEHSGTLLGHSFEDAPLDEDEIAPNYMTHLVLPGALDVLSIPVLAGRGLDSSDLREDVRTVLISESLAKRVWSNPADAVGRRVMPARPQEGGVWYTIVGVVGDAPYGGLARGMKEALYYPFWSLRVGTEDRLYDRQLDLVIKTSLPPASMARAAADEVWSVDPDIPVADIRTLEEVVAQAGLRTRFTMVLLLVAAGVAVMLGAVGLYGAISYVVSLRTREIGIRVALGADPREVRRMVLGRGLALTTVGLVIGLAAAVAAGRFASSQLFGVSSSDPVTFVLASVLLISVALIATYLPARRAAMMDPTEALRCD
jgi:predicted permease